MDLMLAVLHTARLGAVAERVRAYAASHACAGRGAVSLVRDRRAVFAASPGGGADLDDADAVGWASAGRAHAVEGAAVAWCPAVGVSAHQRCVARPVTAASNRPSTRHPHSWAAGSCCCTRTEPR
jgi:hypothetical protein